MADKAPNLFFLREQLRVADALAKNHIEFVVVPLEVLPEEAVGPFTRVAKALADEYLYKGVADA
ncbi:hypothetical protein [Solidesulfovibrio sp.]